MENNKKRLMNKQELIQAVEKARTQTKGEAARLIDMLGGVESNPFVKNEREKRKLQKGLSPEPDKESEAAIDEG